MAIRIGKIPPALKHTGFSATSILPGECTAEFEELRQELVAELTPNGGLEDEIVATLFAPSLAKEKSCHLSYCEARPTANDPNPGYDRSRDRGAEI
jgi:hypothetical protein